MSAHEGNTLTISISHESKHMSATLSPNKAPIALNRWEERQLRRLWHKLGGFATPLLNGSLQSIGLDPDKLNHATLMRIAWEEVYVLYGDQLKDFEALKEQVADPATEWGRMWPPSVVGVDLRGRN